uniref:BhbB3 n=1 Tax=Delftia sp. EOB-17 TaxID=1702119 RepID=A0A0K2BN83_9BURK|nr:tripartite tricarboxylate transporter substrate binding protein [Comamonas sp. 7D-2]AFV28964.1 BhbB [Comamonas sp. 7D-2]AGJ70627.1 BhbB [Comamonas sp. 7D-2]AKZ66508.1 BhbB3 [Delftia sp. EOB-17]
MNTDDRLTTTRTWNRLARRACHALAAAVWAVAATPAVAQADWPNKPIRFIVGFPPGSSPDVAARALQPGLTQALGTPVVVENRAGVTGMIAAEAVARSPNDGYTFLVTSGSAMSISIHTLPRVPINPDKDLTPVAAAARVELFLVADARQGFRNLQDLLTYAKANPGKLTYGSPGNGSAPHVATEMLRAQSGLNALHVPYRGASPALQDLLGGNVQFLFDPGIALEHVRSGKLRLLAVGSTQRSPLFPDTPTIRELGFADFDAGTTHGVYAPAGTPKAIVDRMNAEINKLLVQPQVAQQFEALGAQATPMTPAEFAAVIRRDSARYGAIVRERGIKE